MRRGLKSKGLARNSPEPSSSSNPSSAQIPGSSEGRGNTPQAADAASGVDTDMQGSDNEEDGELRGVYAARVYEAAARELEAEQPPAGGAAKTGSSADADRLRSNGKASTQHRGPDKRSVSPEPGSRAGRRRAGRRKQQNEQPPIFVIAGRGIFTLSSCLPCGCDVVSW